jgi:hypothetical protein
MAKIEWAGAAVVVTAAVAIVGGLWAVYTYFNPAPAKIEVTKTIQYRVCMGDNPTYCPPHNAFVLCYTDLEKWARTRCEKFSKFTSHTNVRRPKSKCGYSITEITCTVKR